MAIQVVCCTDSGKGLQLVVEVRVVLGYGYASFRISVRVGLV